MVICTICKKNFKYYSFFYRIKDNQILCSQCFSSFPVMHKRYHLFDTEIYCIYAYLPPVNSYLMDLKMKNDIALAGVFLSPFKNFFETIYHDYIILPIPSTKRSDQKRGFNHIEEISKALNLKTKKAFIKTKDYKQTSQRFENRKNIENVIKLNIKLDKTKKYLLLDDVITSGSSIKTCLNLLRKQGINKVKVLVVSDNYHK